ncbi:hypothetical protein LXL04_003870 [Taraxacum kok-saghyz]
MKIVSHTKHLLLRFHTGYSESKCFDFTVSISDFTVSISYFWHSATLISHRYSDFSSSRKYRDERDMGEGAKVKDEFPRIAYSGHLLICQIFETSDYTRSSKAITLEVQRQLHQKLYSLCLKKVNEVSCKKSTRCCRHHHHLLVFLIKSVTDTNKEDHAEDEEYPDDVNAPVDFLLDNFNRT